MMVKYSAKVKSPLPLLLFAAGMVTAYLLPLENWAAYAVFGVVAGAASAFVARNAVIRTFEPADAPASEKQKVVAILGLVRLVFGMFLVLLGAFALADWLAPAFDYAGGFLIGTTATTPLRARNYA